MIHQAIHKPRSEKRTDQSESSASPARPPEHSSQRGSDGDPQSGHNFADVAVYPPDHRPAAHVQAQAPSNQTGLPDALKAGVEQLAGISLDDVRVHYNSAKPAQLDALAFAQGRDIHVAPGQEQHLPHETWHLVQQAQSRVKPTMHWKAGVAVNDDLGLEQEADIMGARAVGRPASGALRNPLISQPASAVSRFGNAHILPIQSDNGFALDVRAGDFAEIDPVATQERAGRLGHGFGEVAVMPRTPAAPASPPVQSKGDVGPESGQPIQMKRIIRNGKVTNVPDNYVLQPGEVEERDGGQLIRRRTNKSAEVQDNDPSTGYHPPGRPYMATRDDHHAHGRVAWGSTAFMLATGTVDPVALKNSIEEGKDHLARAKLEENQGFHENARLSRAQAAVTAAQGLTATPVGHMITHPIMHSTLRHISKSIPNPYGDIGWYSGHAIKDQLQKRKKKQHID